jgi:hypothetical protein
MAFSPRLFRWSRNAKCQPKGEITFGYRFDARAGFALALDSVMPDLRPVTSQAYSPNENETSPRVAKKG